jgi:hypothetical protein
MINNNILPYFRKNKSTLLALSAAIAMLLSSLLLPLSNFLVQPVQATSSPPTSVQTDSPVDISKYCNVGTAALAFEAQGTPSSSDPISTTLTSGTFQIINSSSSGQTLLSGHFFRGSITDDPSAGWDVEIWYRVDGTGSVCGILTELDIATSCPGGPDTPIDLSSTGRNLETISGTVDCDTGGDTTTAQPPSLTGSSQGTDRGSGSSSSNSTGSNSGSSSNSKDSGKDSDSDGIPDSSDNCRNHSHHRCFKEGDTSTTTTSSTTTDQPQSSSSSSSNGNGNQTRQ